LFHALILPFVTGHRRQILAEEEGSKNNTSRSIHAGPTNQAVSGSTCDSTGGKYRQVGQKGARDGRQHISYELVLDTPCRLCAIGTPQATLKILLR